MLNKDRAIKIIFILLTGLITQSSFAYYQHSPLNSLLSHTKLTLQLGAFSAHQGSAQNVKIDDLNGDYFTVTKHSDQNVLVGLGLFMDGPDETYINCPDIPVFSTMYGINAFYLPRTDVKGDVIQEQLFTNLSYKYSVTNIPIYLSGKAIFNKNNERFNVTVDLGIGPNIIRAHDFEEKSIDGGVTLPDDIFSNKTKVVLSGTVGIGVQINNVYQNIPVECGYRFFYLGKGRFNTTTNFTSSLHTGNSYANAVLCSVTV